MSINAIVVLVMAMVVLGLGLGFIRGMFGSAEEKFSGAIDAADLTTMPTADNPITLEKQTISVKKGSRGVFIAAFYSDGANTVSLTGATPSATVDGVSCTGMASTCFESPSIDFEDGEAKGFNILVDKTCTTDDVGTKHICSLTLNGNSKQFFVQIS